MPFSLIAPKNVLAFDLLTLNVYGDGTKVTRRVPLVEQELLTFSGAPKVTPDF